MKKRPLEILSDIEHNNDLVVGQKYNGYSESLVIRDGIIRMFNKSGTEQTANVPHITGVEVPGNLDLILVGEGYAPSGRVEDAKSIFGSGPVHAIEKQKSLGLARFTAINITRIRGEDLSHIPFGEKLPTLHQVVTDLIELRMPINQEHLSYSSKRALFDYVVTIGGEGVVVKSLKGFEKDWFKVKKFKYWDAVIMGFTDANEGKTGKFKGLIGAIRYGFYDNNGNLQYTGNCSGMKDEQRVAFSVARESYIGRVVEIKGQELGNKGGIVYPKFERMRDDKLPQECLLGEVRNE